MLSSSLTGHHVHCRCKQEDDERRKAEEKARRDAIFEKYIKRKMAVEGNVENESSSGSGGSQAVRSTPPLSHVVLRRKHTPSRTPSARPLSQPPPAPGTVVATAGALASRGSDENLTEYVNSSPDVRDTGMQLAHGGLTHRRPQTPGN